MKRIFLTILFLLIACNGWSATYYVKTGGNDASAGTSDGAAWDIGAYEYTYDGGTIVNTGAVFSGCSF